MSSIIAEKTEKNLEIFTRVNKAYVREERSAIIWRAIFTSLQTAPQKIEIDKNGKNTLPGKIQRKCKENEVTRWENRQTESTNPPTQESRYFTGCGALR